MQLNTINFFFSHFADQHMNFLYTGNFNDEHTNGFIELNNYQYNSADEYKKLQRKAGFLIAECFQNIVRHNESSNRDSFFHIRNNNGVFSIVSANRVQNKIIPSLKSQLNGLNQLTNDELKEEYRKMLTDSQFSEKGGAGLGLIEMARKSKNKLNFKFTEIDDQNSYFYFKLHLNLINAAKAIDENDFDESVLLRNRMLQDQLFFIYKGVISIQVTIVILEIIENSLDSINQKVVFVKFMGLFERLTAMVPPAFERNTSFLLIGENEIEYNIAASCYLPHNEATQLSRTMKLYSSFDQGSLDNEYKRILADSKVAKGQERNLDLVEILKNSTRLEAHSQSVDENVSLFTLILTFTKKAKPKFISDSSSILKAQSKSTVSDKVES